MLALKGSTQLFFDLLEDLMNRSSNVTHTGELATIFYLHRHSAKHTCEHPVVVKEPFLGNCRAFLAK
jgi:hypothetical protein